MIDRSGSNNAFYGRKHTEESKVKMSFARTGIKRNAEERKKKRKEQTRRQWAFTHPNRVRELEVTYRPRKALANAKRRHLLRLEVIQCLGGRCSNPDCKWLNPDGSLGCQDIRALQIDHSSGGGTRERKQIHWEGMMKKILQDSSHYQLLCANCNWIKAYSLNEFKYKYKLSQEDRNDHFGA